jgi:hypothetical protein
LLNFDVHKLLSRRSFSHRSVYQGSSAIVMIKMEDIAKPCAIAAAAGISSHLLYFIRGEHHQYAHRWITRVLTGIATLSLVILHFTRYQVLLTTILTILLTISYFVGLYTSMGVYRMFFHPLRKFTGPLWAPLSNIYHSYIIRKSDNYLVMKKLHEQYGPIIRTGTLYLAF